MKTIKTEHYSNRKRKRSISGLFLGDKQGNVIDYVEACSMCNHREALNWAEWKGKKYLSNKRPDVAYMCVCCGNVVIAMIERGPRVPEGKEIAEIVNKGSRTDIHRLFTLLHGGYHDSRGVYDLVMDYATSKRRKRQAYAIAYGGRPGYSGDNVYKGNHGYYKPLPRQAARLFFDREAKRERNSYTKVATLGHTHLYATSPVYRHGDYNKARMLPIAGNERTCEILVRKYGE